MTHAQKWVAAFLLVFLGLFFISQFSSNEESSLTDNNLPYDEVAKVSGAELFVSSGCVGCHGADLMGTTLAPKLTEVAEHWTRDGIINYLRNPAAYDGGERFDELRSKYAKSIMPNYTHIQVQDLGKLADYLLKNK